MLDSMDPREFENKLSKEELRKRVKDLRLRTKLTEPEFVNLLLLCPS